MKKNLFYSPGITRAIQQLQQICKLTLKQRTARGTQQNSTYSKAGELERALEELVEKACPA